MQLFSDQVTQVGEPVCWDECGSFLSVFIERQLPQRLRRYLGVSDIVQSVLFAAERNRSSFRGNTAAQVRAWLAMVARRKIIDGLRRYQKQHCCVRASEWLASARTDEWSLEPHQRLASEEDAIRLIAAIDELPPLQREIVTLRYLHNMTFDEISAQLSIAVTTCRRHWLEGIESLGTRLQSLLE
jgi:RNA polymerase sigma-70 factor (ECF subfamily)